MHYCNFTNLFGFGEDLTLKTNQFLCNETELVNDLTNGVTVSSKSLWVHILYIESNLSQLCYEFKNRVAIVSIHFMVNKIIICQLHLKILHHLSNFLVASFLHLSKFVKLVFKWL